MLLYSILGILYAWLGIVEKKIVATYFIKNCLKTYDIKCLCAVNVKL